MQRPDPAFGGSRRQGATVAVEVVGTGRQDGWDVGGWAYGTSGYATVAWFALVLVALA